MQTPALFDSVTMTSLELVDFINQDEPLQNLTHANFLAKVPKVLGGSANSFECAGTYTNGTGVVLPRKIYRFPKREACLMAMSYSYSLQAKVFDRMTALEAELAPKVPKTMAQALRLAAEQAEQLETQAEQLALAAPKVEFVDRFVDATGLKGFREVCKLLKANEARFREFVISEKILYRLAGTLTAHQNHIDAGRFEVRTGVAETEHAYTATKFTPKGVNWIAGEWAKYQLKGQDGQI